MNMARVMSDAEKSSRMSVKFCSSFFVRLLPRTRPDHSLNSPPVRLIRKSPMITVFSCSRFSSSFRVHVQTKQISLDQIPFKGAAASSCLAAVCKLPFCKLFLGPTNRIEFGLLIFFSFLILFRAHHLVSALILLLSFVSYVRMSN